MGQTGDRGAGVSRRVTLPERYEPIRRIARGGMATVWCAHDRTLDRRVAIKLLANPYATDELAGRRFTREARAAARLSGHTNVVTIYDVGRALPTEDVPAGRPFIVMEYLAGGTLADALRTGEFGHAAIVKWLREAAMALDFAHRRGVIHRDVKPSNFLLDCDRTLHVADFGIAELATEDTLSASGEVIGTAAYLAPERALGLPATESSDRYSLAVAAFELLVGARPFFGRHFAVQARQHVEEPPPRASERNPALPPALDAVLLRAMAKHPEERFGTATELVDEIERALTPSPVKRVASPQRGSAPTPITIYGRRGRARIAAITAISAALIAVALAAGATLLPRAPQRTADRSQAARLLTARTTSQATQTASTARHTASPAPNTALSVAKKTSPAAVATPPATSSSQPAAAASPPALEVQGHQLLTAGDYQGAIRVLREAVSSAPRSSLTYAYALFDLGRSLRLAGDPRAAVPILWQRLQIPNQTDVVRNELTLALQALGQQVSSPGGAGTSLADLGRGHGHHDGQAGGPGDSQGD